MSPDCSNAHEEAMTRHDALAGDDHPRISAGVCPRQQRLATAGAARETWSELPARSVFGVAPHNALCSACTHGGHLVSITSSPHCRHCSPSAALGPLLWPCASHIRPYTIMLRLACAQPGAGGVLHGFLLNYPMHRQCQVMSAPHSTQAGSA